eukprot:422137-Hanusia_phi.AAC.1
MELERLRDAWRISNTSMQEPTGQYRRIDMQIVGIPQHMLPQRGYFDYLAERMQEISDTQDGIHTKAPIHTDIINPKEVTITVSTKALGFPGSCLARCVVRCFAPVASWQPGLFFA